MKFQRCTVCGCALDYGEKCDCYTKKEDNQKRLESSDQAKYDEQMNIINSDTSN